MKTIKKILAPTDLSDLSQAGIRYALNLARTSGAEVIVYHVVSLKEIMHYSGKLTEWSRNRRAVHLPLRLLEMYSEALARFLNQHFSDLLSLVRVHEKVELGIPDKNIAEEAKREGVDLIVISTHGRTGLSHMLMGSVTEKVVRHAPCPVLSIRPHLPLSEMQKVAAAA